MPIYLSFKEIWRNRGRFLLFSLVIALITVLVLFIAALASGLATANRQFLQKLNADLLIFQENSDLSTSASRLGVSTLKNVRRVEGVQDVGALGFATASLTFSDGSEPVDVALVGVQPGKPGEPALLAGSPFRSPRWQGSYHRPGAGAPAGSAGWRLAQREVRPGDERRILQAAHSRNNRPAPVLLCACGNRANRNLG